MPKTSGLTRGERLQIMLSPEELESVDDFRFKQRMPSRAAAVRELFRLGLANITSAAAQGGQKSSTYGVTGSGKDDGGNGKGDKDTSYQ
jgi:hypothetical protein